MRTLTTIVTILTGAALAACGGGSSAAAKKDMGAVGAGAKPPPSVTGPQKIDREVTDQAKRDFGQAVRFYQEQEKAGWNRQRCTAAARRFEQVASSHQKMVEARFNAGLSYQQCNMKKEAEVQYQAALKINPAHGASLSNLGEIYFRDGNERVGRQYWDSAIKADPRVGAARNNLAWLIIRELRESRPTGAAFNRLHDEAAGQLSRVLAVQHDNVEAHVLYALLYMEGSERNRTRLALAKLLLDKAEEINPQFPALHNARGLLLLRQEDVANALASFQRAVQLDPRFAEARMNVGSIVIDFRKYDEGESHFAEVLKLRPKDYDAHIGIGIAQRGLRKLDEAEASYNRAKSIDSRRPDAHFNLGVLYQDFRANAPANSVAELRSVQNHYREAIKHFRQAISSAGQTGNIRQEAEANIRVCERNIKSLDDAIRFQQQAPAGGGGKSP
jgi:tetratricopeptide (TPR) repeat protein